ncbi:MAG: hypothetical protein K9M57_08260 [Phycisphaerae bacterium]|nr:hypothetical protein [Phycisphaerae bacterium]
MKITRRINIVVLMTVMLMGGSVMAAGTYSGGDGLTEATAYQIATAADLDEVGNHSEDWDKHFILTADIDMSGYSYTKALIAPDITNSNTEFDGIPFSGVFDGDGYIISGMTIDTNGGNEDYLGLFGTLSAIVINLGIENFSITSGDNSDCLGGLCGWNYLGTIRSCYATGSIKGGDKSSRLGGLCGHNYQGTIRECYSSGSVDGYSGLGGLCGINEQGTLTYSYSNCSTTGESSLSGGLCGGNSGSILTCYATGPVYGGFIVGGLCALNDGGIIDASYSAGCVSSNTSFFLGGLCGKSNDGSTIRNSFWDMERAGWGSSEGGVGLTTVQMKSESIFTDAGWAFYPTSGSDIADWYMLSENYPEFFWQYSVAYDGDFSLELTKHTSGQLEFEILSLKDMEVSWTITGHDECTWITEITPSTGSFNRPNDKTTAIININTDNLAVGEYICDITLTSSDDDMFILPIVLNVVLPGTGISENPYLVEDISDFDEIADSANSDKYWASGVYIKLMSDIDLGGRIYDKAVIAPNGENASGFNATPYSGVFDGDGHVIRNLSIQLNDYSDYIGLFGMINDDAEIKQLGVENVTIQCTEKGSAFSGALCGYNNGKINDCYATGTITGNSRVGGLCGYNTSSGIITQCNTAVSISGRNSVGGLCGYNESGMIRSSYSTGAIKVNAANSYDLGGLCGTNDQGTIFDCYATGAVEGGNETNKLGGLCGKNIEGTISNCYATGTISGNDFLGGLCGSNVGEISNSYATGAVSGNSSLGGFCGTSRDGLIKNSYATGNVTGTSTIGGFCGYCKGTISNCYAMGSVSGDDVVGGLCGYNKYNSNMITNCYSTGWVTGGEDSIYVGGLIGSNTYSNNVVNCLWNKQTSGMAIGIGQYEGYNVFGKSTAEMQVEKTFSDYGWCFDDNDGNSADWSMSFGGYPNLSWQSSAGHGGEYFARSHPNKQFEIEITVFHRAEEMINWTLSGDEDVDWITDLSPVTGTSNGPDDKTTVTASIDTTGLPIGHYICNLLLESDKGDLITYGIHIHVPYFWGSGAHDDPFVISDLGGFDEFCKDISYWNRDVHTRLDCDLDLSVKGVYTQAPIAPGVFEGGCFSGEVYRGRFDGDGHVIRNLTVNGKDYCGLFGYIGDAGSLMNLGLENVSITGSGVYAGGLVSQYNNLGLNFPPLSRQ